jgi:4-hydroxybenzoate polyprenyltransferase
MLVVLLKYRDINAHNYWMYAFLLILPAVLTAASGYVVNDIYDIETDKINKPKDQIVGVSLSAVTSWKLYASLSLVSIIVSFLYSNQYAILNVCILAMLYLYAIQLKGLPLIGNIIIALCSSAVFAICILYTGKGGSLIVFQEQGFWFFIGYIIFAFLISLIRELIKDMQDLEGDRVAGLRTYPIVFGMKGSKILIYFFTSIEIICCGIFSFLSWGLDFYSASILMGLITLSLLYFINQLSRSKDKSHYGDLSKLLKYIMFAGVIALILL